MNSKYDIIIIGGGHNGLTAAAMLAKKSKKVLLLEARDVIGGMAAKEEYYDSFYCPGLLQDTSLVRKGLLKPLNLEKFGVTIHDHRESVTLVNETGETLTLSHNAEDTAREIAKFSQKDAEAYIRYRSFIDKVGKFLWPLLNEIPPDLMNFGTKEIMALGRKSLSFKQLGKTTMNEFLKVAPMSLRDYLDELFETDFLKAGIAAPALQGSFTGPYSSYTTLNLLIWECSARHSVSGGINLLINGLEQAALNLGVKIKKGSEVERIIIQNDVVKGICTKNGEEYHADVVVSSLHPKETFLNLIDPLHLSFNLEQKITQYRSRGTTAMINIALNRPLQFKGLNGNLSSRIRICSSLLEMEKAFDAVKYGEYSKVPIIEVFVSSEKDDTMAPKGSCSVAVMIQYAPYDLKKGWNLAEKEFLAKTAIDQLVKYTENLSSSIEGLIIFSPKDLEEILRTSGGHIYHGEPAVDQILTRPIPECARYDTPIKGLFLCGSGSHPGGGITCAPGALAAKRIIQMT